VAYGTSATFRVLAGGLLFVAIGAFYLITIRAGHPWGDDFAMYVQEAIDLAHHESYTHSQYILDPLNPGYAPQVYPPGYPLALVPVYECFGVNLSAMKVENILFLVVSLIICFLLFRYNLTFSYACVAIALIGFNPRFWDIKDNVLSEFFYLALLSLALYVIRRIRQFPGTPRLYMCAGLSILIYLTYITRNTGLLIVASMLFIDFSKSKRVTRLSAIVAAGVFALSVGQRALIAGAEQGYLDQLRLTRPTALTILHNIYEYIWSLSTFWGLPDEKHTLLLIIFAVFTSFSMYGYFLKIKRDAAECEVYVPLHVGIVVLWPVFAGFRLLIPVFPFYVFYGVLGISEAMKLCQRKRPYVPALALVVVAAAYVYMYRQMDFGPIRDGIEKRETQEFFRYVRDNTPANAIFICSRPRALALFTQRAAAVTPILGSDQAEEDAWKFLGTIHASYLVNSPMDDPLWVDFLSRNRSALVESFSNRDIVVYRLAAEKSRLEDLPQDLSCTDSCKTYTHVTYF